MRAQLRRLHSPDVHDLVNFQPDVRESFGFLLQVLVGPSEGEGEESFDVVVCTPDWLRERHNPTDIIVGRHYLIVLEYNHDRLWRFLENYCSQCYGESWQDIANQLGRLGRWEFEDYKPAPISN